MGGLLNLHINMSILCNLVIFGETSRKCPANVSLGTIFEENPENYCKMRYFLGSPGGPSGRPRGGGGAAWVGDRPVAWGWGGLLNFHINWSILCKLTPVPAINRTTSITRKVPESTLKFRSLST